MLIIITSTGDELLRNINIDDLEWLWFLKILVFTDFLAIFGCKGVNCDEMDADGPRLPANRKCYRLSRVSWALAEISCLSNVPPRRKVKEEGRKKEWGRKERLGHPKFTFTPLLSCPTTIQYCFIVVVRAIHNFASLFSTETLLATSTGGGAGCLSSVTPRWRRRTKICRTDSDSMSDWCTTAPRTNNEKRQTGGLTGWKLRGILLFPVLVWERTLRCEIFSTANKR